MDIVNTQSTSLHSAKVSPIVIEETILQGKETRKVLICEINDAKTDTGETVNITIAHQRRAHGSSDWEDASHFNQSTMKSGEEVRMSLKSAATKRLYDALKRLYALAKERGVELGTRSYMITNTERMSEDQKLIIEKLLKEGHGKEIWDHLVSTDADLVETLSKAQIQMDRQKVVNEFKTQLDAEIWKEGDWQKFFEKNTWIFGYGLRYQFCNALENQPEYGGSTFHGTGMQRGDMLLNTDTVVNAKFTVLVELKTPQTKLLEYQKVGIPIIYRNGAYQLSRDLIGPVTQMQTNARTWAFNSQTKLNSNELEGQGIYTVEPKGILVIGNLSELCINEHMRNSFELFRRNLHNPEILTYDELYVRAFFIAHDKMPSEDDTGESELPF